MDLWSIVRVVFARRWYVALPLLVLTVLSAVVLANRVKPTYEATGNLLLLVPDNISSSTGKGKIAVNPYLGFNGSVTVTANAIYQILNDQRQRETLQKAGLISSYTVVASQDFPLVTVTAGGPESTHTLQTVQVLISIAQGRLFDEQAAVHAPSDQFISSRVLSQSVETKPPSRSRLVVVIIGLGLALAIGLSLLVEWLGARRRERPEHYNDVPSSMRPLERAPLVDHETSQVAEQELGSDLESAADPVRMGLR